MHYEVRVRLAMHSSSKESLEDIGRKIEDLVRNEWEKASKTPNPIIIDGEVGDVKKSYRSMGFVPDQRTHRTGGRKASRRIVRIADDS